MHVRTSMTGIVQSAICASPTMILIFRHGDMFPKVLIFMGGATSAGEDFWRQHTYLSSLLTE